MTDTTIARSVTQGSTTPLTMQRDQWRLQDSTKAIADSTKEGTTGQINTLRDLKDPHTYFFNRIGARFGDVVKDNQTVQSSIEVQRRAIDEIKGLLTKVNPTFMRDVTAGGGEGESVRAQAREALLRIEALLNTQDATGHYVFGGENSDSTPVSGVATNPSHYPTKSEDTTYYLGSGSPSYTALDPNNTDSLTEMNIVGSHPAIERTIQALSIARDANNRDERRCAFEVGQIALEKLGSLSEELQNRIDRVTEVNKVVESVETLSRNSLSEMITIPLEGIMENREEIARQQLAQQFAISIRESAMRAHQEMMRSSIF